MAGMNVNIANAEEAKAIQAKQTAALNGLVDDVNKTVSSLKGIDASQIGNIANTAITYTESMAQLLQQAAEVNEDAQKKFKTFIEAIEEVENSELHLD